MLVAYDFREFVCSAKHALAGSCCFVGSSADPACKVPECLSIVRLTLLYQPGLHLKVECPADMHEVAGRQGRCVHV